MKYLNTAAKMKKEYAFVKKDKNNYFYSFDRIIENIPEEIRESFIDKCVNSKTSIINPTTVVTIEDHDNGMLYYIDVDFKPYNVFKNDKCIYKCLDAMGIKVRGYKYNIYGCVNDSDLPIISEEYGRMAKSVIINIEDIELD